MYSRYGRYVVGMWVERVGQQGGGDIASVVGTALCLVGVVGITVGIVSTIGIVDGILGI